MESGRMWEYEWLGGWGVGGQGALVCKPETLAVTVNKLTERKTGVQKEDIRRRTSDVKTERGKSSAPHSGVQGFTFARPPGAIGPVFMVCPFPGLPSQHNELHYSGLLTATIAGLFCHDTLKSSIKTARRASGREKVVK